MNILFQVALRNVFRNRRRSLFTLSALVVGLAVVLMITAVANSFHRFSVENAVNAKLGALQIHRSGYMNNLSLNPLSFKFEYSRDLLEKIESVRGVKAASGRIAFRGLVSNGRNQALFFANAVDVSREEKVCPRWLGALTLGSSALLSTDSAHAMVGHELARSLSVAPRAGVPAEGDASFIEAAPVEVASDTLNLSAASPEGRQNAVDVQVKATIRSLLPIEEKRSMVVPLSLAQSLLGMAGKVTEIAVAVDELDEISTVQRELQLVLGSEYEVSSWADVQPFLRDIVFRQRVMIAIVSVILFVLVLFVIANTMTMAVFERTREIGTMLSVGIKRGQIQTIFFSEALFVGVVGGFIGLVLGLVGVLITHRIGIPFGSVGFERGILRPFLTLEFVVAAFCVAVLCSGIAGIFPAKRAAGMNPVDALRSN
ncbi:MAG: ABC transporter permease [Betaproteobacteria bacterium]|nr:ABC transporter permease [Betaproteobacteria bacterium]